jgi:MFS-type transporter involved in bile tolerance (Atg22 family)
MGLVITLDGVAEALAPMLAAWLRDRTGSYANGFAALIILALIGTVVIIMLPRKKNI